MHQSSKEILSEYTALTGRAPTPPLWTFGLWMGRESYYSEEETRAVAEKLREERMPSDVIHLDTGWSEVPSRCDFEFSHSRFVDPKIMLAHLKESGLRVSLWQLPYFNPKKLQPQERAARRGHGERVRGPLRQRPPARGRRRDRPLQSRGRSMVQGQAREAASYGGWHLHRGFRRSGPALRPLPLQACELPGAQPLPLALQQGGLRGDGRSVRSRRHLRQERLGRKPALPVA